jgi:ribosomal protein S18 acetylase RimI-like enzyme
MLVRAAGPDDAAEVERAVASAVARLREIYRPSPDAIAHAKTLPLERLVAADGDRIAGTVQFRVDGHVLRVVGLAVVPACQRRGVARALVEQLVAVALERGCSVLGLFTIEQTGNVAVFGRLGFRVMWRRPDVWSISVTGEPLTEVYLERSVA